MFGYTGTLGQGDTVTHAGKIALRHQLYESLTTTPDIHGTFSRSTGPDSSLDTASYGPGLDEEYAKRLGSWWAALLGNAVEYDQQHYNSQGQSQSILDEPHTLTDGVVTLLNRPLVDVSTIRVTDSAHTIVYVENLDYVVIQQGDRTQIQRVFVGTIPNGSTVLVSYSAASLPSANYQTLSDQLLIRLDLYDGLLGLYGRLRELKNYGGSSLVLENINDKVAGVDVTKRWVRAGAEYEDLDSNISPYHAARLFEDFTFG